MKHITLFAFLFSLFSLAVIGCSSGGDPIPTPVVADSVAYKTSTNYKYVEHQRDTTDKNIAIADTITSAVKTTDTTFDEKNHAVIIQNVHMNGAAMDSTVIAQSNGEFWHHNFGLEGFDVFLKGSLGWVLQAKLNAKEGDTWVAKGQTSVQVNGFPLQVNVSINALEKADTTIMVGTESVAVKHVQHTVTINAGQSIVSNVDTYVSSKYGIIANVRHSTKIDVPGVYTGPVPGSERVMVSHP